MKIFNYQQTGTDSDKFLVGLYFQNSLLQTSISTTHMFFQIMHL